jgi:NADH-quinone oxidoreductase subunit H
MRRFLPLVLVSLAGCIAEPPPTTLEVADVQPHEVDVGDKLEIRGAGFPTRRTAKVVFAGNVYRGGVPPESVNATFEIESRSEGRLEIPVDDTLAARFSATSDTGHATFRGEVSVSFAASEAGAAPLRGRANNVVLDVRGARSKKVVHGRDAAQKALDGLGLTIAEEAPASGGLVVAAVRPGSPAAGAGILAKDVIVDFDGVRVASIVDLVPAGDTTATLAIRRDGQSELRTIAVPLDGALRRVPRAMIAGAGLVAAATLLLLLSLRRPSAASTVVERRIAARVRALSPGLRAGAQRSIVAMLAGESSLRPSLGALVFSFVCAAVSVATPLFLPDLDVVTLAVAAFAASLAVALEAPSVGTHVLRIARPHLAGALAVACAVLSTGAFRLADLLRAQGAFPWDWLAFRTPATLASVVLWMVAAAALPRDRGVDRAARYVAAGLTAMLFFGGFRVPTVRTIEHEAWSLAAIGALVMVVKAWIAMTAIEVLRVFLPVVRASTLRVRLAVVMAFLSPLAAFALAGLPWTVARALGITTFGAVAVTLAFAGMRLYASLTRTSVGHLDPHV